MVVSYDGAPPLGTRQSTSNGLSPVSSNATRSRMQGSWRGSVTIRRMAVRGWPLTSNRPSASVPATTIPVLSLPSGVRRMTVTSAPGSGSRVPFSRRRPTTSNTSGGGGGGGGAASTAPASAAPAPASGASVLGTKCSVYSIRIAAGLPSISAGENRYCSTASRAASSNPCPTGLVTSALLTFPSASMSTIIVTSADTFCASASGG